MSGEYIDGIMNQGTLEISNSEINANSTKGNVFGIESYENSTTNIQNANINTNADEKDTTGISNATGANMTIQNSSISVNADTQGSFGVVNNSSAKMTVINTNVFADSTESSGSGSNNGIGISNTGEMKFYSGSVYGVHSGITNSANGKLYVYGGTLDGYGHGGIYFAQGTSGEAYVENATLKSGEYNGKHDESKFTTIHGGSFYIGGGDQPNNSNNKVYMNGCTLTSVEGTIGVLRGTSGETNNQLYISNSTIESGKKMRIDGKNKLFVGKGMNVTEADVTLSKDKNNYIPTFAEAVEFTNEEYKR